VANINIVVIPIVKTQIIGVLLHVSEREKADFQHPPMWMVCNDGTIYTGCTNNLKDRLHWDSKGQISYTSSRLPV